MLRLGSSQLEQKFVKLELVVFQLLLQSPLSRDPNKTIPEKLASVQSRHMSSAVMPAFGAYPAVRRDESLVETIHGHSVSDPYRWLEDPDSAETKAFVDAQNDLTRPFLQQCPIREKYKTRLTELWDYPKYSCPRRVGDHYFYSHNSGLQNQSVMYIQDSVDGEPRVFLDPNKLSDDGTIALSGRAFSDDGTLFAYGLSQSGSDWIKIKFKDVKTGDDLEDVLEHVKFSCMSWTHDNKGIFYNRYPTSADGRETTSNVHQKLYYHYLGTPQEEDVLVAEFPDHPKWMAHAEVTDCGRYAIITISEGCDPVNKLYYADLHELGAEGIKTKLDYKIVVDNFDAEYEYITNEGTVFTFKTNLQAPHYKLITIDMADPKYEKKDLVPESATDVLNWALCVSKDKLVLNYLQDVKAALFLHDLTTGSRLRRFPLDIGTINGVSGDKKYDDVFYSFVSFLTPGTIFRIDVTKESNTPSVFRQIAVKNFDGSQFETKQVFYPSKDGTKVPMFIIHRKGLKLDGSSPTFLYGYGGFSISITPSFSVSRAVFLQHFGGIYAVANIRGGGEYGETWHKGGVILNKQNVFDDFQAAGEYLVNEGFADKSKLIINGGSNGGLLVAACCNQRPDLFKCGVAQVGVMDMLRFHKFTIGHAWTTDFGDPDKKEHFENLIKFSPLHNVPDLNGTQYPALLLLTADHDDRVVPLHSFKLIAELQHKIGSKPSQKNPMMIWIDTKAGHGGGKPTAKIIEEQADIAAFMHGAVGLTWTD